MQRGRRLAPPQAQRLAEDVPGAELRCGPFTPALVEDGLNLVLKSPGLSPLDPAMAALIEAGVLAKLTGLLAGAGISIDAILQREADQVSGANQTDVIILTHDTREGTMNGVLAQMQALPTVLAPIVRIRKEELA